jgi:MoaA/NifB/PqqE/SkfB family radical SAM enzyme
MDVLMNRLVKDAKFTAGLALRKPFSCLVQVTNRCNMMCSFCDFWPNVAPKKDELTVADYERVAAEMAELGTYCVSIEGGEPFARTDLLGIVKAFAKAHVPVLFTNGWYVTEENARALWDAGLSQASVSIDYPDAERHDAKRRVKGTTARAWRAVEIFRDTAPRGERQVNVMTVLMEDNWRDFGRLLAQSAAAGVGHQVTLISVAGCGRGSPGQERGRSPSPSARRNGAPAALRAQSSRPLLRVVLRGHACVSLGRSPPDLHRRRAEHEHRSRGRRRRLHRAHRQARRQREDGERRHLGPTSAR